MITPEQAQEIRSLASRLSTKRVRRFAVSKGLGGPGETLEATQRAVDYATDDLEMCLARLTQQTTPA
jgi:uncharacterized protein YerC